MMTTRIGQLSVEDLTRWRLMCARFGALSINCEAYSQSETEQICKERIMFLGQVTEQFDIDDERPWDVSPGRGVVYYTGE